MTTMLPLALLVLSAAVGRPSPADSPAAIGRPSPADSPAAIGRAAIGRPSPADSPAEAAVGQALDDFHQAAAAADERRYFAHFAPDGVFLGTDPHERWTVEAFQAYAHPHFAAGKGWTYVPVERHVAVTDDFAWFDEVVHSEKYGACRGTGVLRRIGGKWLVEQYSLTFLVPNALAERVTGEIRRAKR